MALLVTALSVPRVVDRVTVAEPTRTLLPNSSLSWIEIALVVAPFAVMGEVAAVTVEVAVAAGPGTMVKVLDVAVRAPAVSGTLARIDFPAPDRVILMSA